MIICFYTNKQQNELTTQGLSKNWYMECKELTQAIPPYAKPRMILRQSSFASLTCCLTRTKSGLNDLQ
jgi:hypothetical protein